MLTFSLASLCVKNSTGQYLSIQFNIYNLSTIYNGVGKWLQVATGQGQEVTEVSLLLSKIKIKLPAIMYSNRQSRSPWQCCWAGWDATVKTLVSVGWYSGCLGVQSPLLCPTHRPSAGFAGLTQPMAVMSPRFFFFF